MAVNRDRRGLWGNWLVDQRRAHGNQTQRAVRETLAKMGHPISEAYYGDDYGDAGFELVAVHREVQRGHGDTTWVNPVIRVHAYFKRPKRAAARGTTTPRTSASRKRPWVQWLVLCQRVETHQPFGGRTIHHTLDRLVASGFPVEEDFILAASFNNGDGGDYDLQVTVVYQSGASKVLFDGPVVIPIDESLSVELKVTVAANGPGLRFYVVHLDGHDVGILRLRIDPPPPTAPGIH